MLKNKNKVRYVLSLIIVSFIFVLFATAGVLFLLVGLKDNIIWYYVFSAAAFLIAIGEIVHIIFIVETKKGKTPFKNKRHI